MELTSAMQLTQEAARQTAPPPLPKTSDPKKARAAAETFEAFFIGHYLEQMFAGVRTDGIFGGGNSENIYRSLMLQEVGKNIAANGGIGIADAVQREILRIQEAAQQQEQAK
jgi:Rod binding domain-containing protein